ncbi:MAG: response regulator [Hydrococcus sp. Prado102]|jgi:CheY-like chemotaxis protein|nr:response regulator [Hydrococcus sp. Prado102]
MKTMTARVILLINDKTLVREVIELCLQDLAGWQVFSVASRTEGLKIARTESLDAIVLDICCLDSLMFLQQLKANPATQSIPIVLLTNQEKRFTPQQLQQFTIVGVVEQPFMPLDLPSQIATFLGWNEIKC